MWGLKRGRNGRGRRAWRRERTATARALGTWWEAGTEGDIQVSTRPINMTLPYPAMPPFPALLSPAQAHSKPAPSLNLATCPIHTHASQAV